MIGLAALIPIGLGLYWATREPLCQGKPIRVWVEQIGTAGYGARDLAEEQLQTACAIAIPAMLEALQSDGKSLRDQINDGWLKVWSKLPQSIQKITPKPRFYFRPDRRMWINSLARLGPHDKRVVKAIIHELGSKDSEVRFFATSSLGELARNWSGDLPKQRQIIESLELMLKDPAFNVRGCAAYGLAKCGPVAQGSVPALVAMLADPQEHSRSAAVRALAYIGGNSNIIVPAITPLLQSTQFLTRAFAAYALCRVTGEMEPGLPVLAELLSAEEHEWEDSPRSVAAGLIGRLGTPAETALPELQHALETSETDGRIAAALAIWKITGNPSNAIPMMRSLLAKGNRGERIWITQSLAEFGPQAVGALPELLEALDDDDFVIRRNAVRALASIGPAAATALPKLQIRLKDPFPSIQKSAAEAIKALSGLTPL